MLAEVVVVVLFAWFLDHFSGVASGHYLGLLSRVVEVNDEGRDEKEEKERKEEPSGCCSFKLSMAMRKEGEVDDAGRQSDRTATRI